MSINCRSKEEATRRAKSLLRQMPANCGWRASVWENLGWHYRVVNQHVSVDENRSGDKVTYDAMISDTPDGIGTPSHWFDAAPPVPGLSPLAQRGAKQYDTPLEAVHGALQKVIAERDMINQVVRVVSGVIVPLAKKENCNDV